MFVDQGNDGYFIDPCGNSGPIEERESVLRQLEKLVGRKKVMRVSSGGGLTPPLSGQDQATLDPAAHVER